MNIKKLFGEKVKEKRIGLGLTQDELAARIGISSKTLSQIELGNNFVSAENLEAISNALNVSPKVLFDFVEINEEHILDFVNSKIANNKILLNKIYKLINIIE